MRFSIWIVLLLFTSRLEAATGVVVDRSGKPLAAATVELYSIETPEERTARLLEQRPRKPIATTKSRDDGSFVIAATGKTIADLHVHSAGRVRFTKEIHLDHDLSAIVLDQERLVPILLTIGGKKASDAVVLWSGKNSVIESKTDEEGRILLHDFTGGARTISVLERSRRTWHSPTHPIRSASVVLPAPVVLNGKIVDEKKNPVASASILIDGQKAGHSGEDGTFEVHASANWKLLAIAEGGRRAERRPGQWSRGQIVTLRKATPIAVAVSETGGARLENALVSLRSESGDLVESGLTGADGSARFFVVPGLYRLAAAAPGFSNMMPLKIEAGVEAVERRILLARLSPIRVLVSTEDGKPVGLAEVGSALGTVWRDTVVTTPEGRATVYVPPTAQVRLQARDAFHAATKSDLIAGTHREVVRLTLVTGIAFRGFVVDERQKPVAGVRVFVQESDPAVGNQLLMLGEAAATSDREGAFLVRLTKGRHSFRFQREGYALEDRLAVPVSDDLDPLKIVLSKGATISGRVMRGNIGLGGVMIYTAGIPQPPPVTAPDGSFVIEDLEAGTPLAFDFRSREQFVELRQTFEAPASNVVVEVPPGGTLKGRVRTRHGERPVTQFEAGISGIRVTPTSSRMGPHSLRSFTNEDGSFVLENLPPGPMDLLVVAPGFANATVPGLTIENGKTLDGIEVLVEPSARVVGRVTDSGGVALEGAGVVVEAAVGERSRAYRTESVMTDDRGEFRFEALDAGDTRFHVTKDGFARLTKVVALERKENQVELRLERGVSLRGLVKDFLSRPVADAEIRLLGSDGRGAGGRSKGDGSFLVSGLAPGIYRIVAEKSGAGKSGAREIQVADSTNLVELTLEEGGGVIGRVTGLVPQKLAEVVIENENDWPPLAARVDREGNYRLEGLRVGNDRISASIDKGSQRLSREVLIEKGQQTRADFHFDSGFKVHGRVTKRDEPQAALNVNIFPKDDRAGSRARVHVTSVTRGDGTFEVELSEPGDYLIALFDTRTMVSKRFERTIRGETTLELDMQSAGLRGRVVDATTKAAVGGASVVIAKKDARTRFDETGAVTAPDGTFDVPTLDAGEYVVRAKRERYSSDPLEVTVGSNGASVEIPLRAASRLEIRLIAAKSGQVIPGNFAVYDARGANVYDNEARQGTNGSYLLELNPGSYLLVASSPGQGTRTVRIDVPSSSMTLTMGPAGALEVRGREATERKFRLIDESSNPYYFSSWERSPIQTIRSRQDYEFVAAGSYVAQILDSNDRVIATKPVRITEGGKTLLSLD